MVETGRHRLFAKKKGKAREISDLASYGAIVARYDFRKQK